MFKNKKLQTVVVNGFTFGDCLVVPTWNGINFDNFVVPSANFEILQSAGDRLQSVVYIVESKKLSDGHKYTLLQYITAVRQDNGLFTNVYRLFAAKDDKLAPDGNLLLDEWKDYTSYWAVPNVDRLLVGRFRSATTDPSNPNAVKGLPICYGASSHIREIHTLLDQMSAEFHLSQKAVFADKKLFTKRTVEGKEKFVLPDKDNRLYKLVEGGGRNVDSSPLLHDWAPDIRYQAYLEALDKQEQLVERAVGVSNGILSTVNEANYQNVDNVRKSMAKTQAFIDTARKYAEEMLDDVIYSWNVLLNYYNVNPMGEYEIQYDWSDEYIDTFADRQNAILAGEAIGATDAADYRAFVMGETPDVARENVRRIKSEKQVSSPLFKLEA